MRQRFPSVNGALAMVVVSPAPVPVVWDFGTITPLVERFTRVDPDTLVYEFTGEDPKTWTTPWTASVTMKKIPGAIYEYACHEGNDAMFSILAGARARDGASTATVTSGAK